MYDKVEGKIIIIDPESFSLYIFDKEDSIEPTVIINTVGNSVLLYCIITNKNIHTLSIEELKYSIEDIII